MKFLLLVLLIACVDYSFAQDLNFYHTDSIRRNVIYSNSKNLFPGFFRMTKLARNRIFYNIKPTLAFNLNRSNKASNNTPLIAGGGLFLEAGAVALKYKYFKIIPSIFGNIESYTYSTYKIADADLGAKLTFGIYRRQWFCAASGSVAKLLFYDWQFRPNNYSPNFFVNRGLKQDYSFLLGYSLFSTIDISAIIMITANERYTNSSGQSIPGKTMRYIGGGLCYHF
jgi:hypothetical protein